jgi:hypothetical protein
MPIHPHQWTVMFLDKGHHPGTVFDRVAPLSAKDNISLCRPSTAQTRQKQGKNLGFTLRMVFVAPTSEGKILSIGCPDLATVVQIWPAVSILGQFWPSLANLVHVALSYAHRVVLRGRRWALKSENSLRKAREQPTPRFETLPRGACGRSRPLPGPQGGSRHETHAPQFPRSRQRGRRLAHVGAAHC